jgi:hypothetical protein
MYKLRKAIVISALIVVLTAVSPIFLAQNKQANSPTARNSASIATEGKILWQYNTDG